MKMVNRAEAVGSLTLRVQLTCGGPTAHGRLTPGVDSPVGDGMPVKASPVDGVVTAAQAKRVSLLKDAAPRCGWAGPFRLHVGHQGHARAFGGQLLHRPIPQCPNLEVAWKSLPGRGAILPPLRGHSTSEDVPANGQACPFAGASA